MTTDEIDSYMRKTFNAIREGSWRETGHSNEYYVGEVHYRTIETEERYKAVHFIRDDHTLTIYKQVGPSLKTL